MLKNNFFVGTSFLSIVILGYGINLISSGIGSSLSILLFKYLLLPFTFLLFGFSIIRLNNFYFIPSLLSLYKWQTFFIGLTIWYVFQSLTLKVLKLMSQQYPFFDAGLYANKLWKISHSGSLEAIKLSIFDGHFQPILIPYAFLYRLAGNNILLPFALETLCLASSALPIYLISRKFFSQDSSLAISLTFFLYPLLMFNDILGFHPDHLILPIILWAFYFSYSGLFFRSFCFILLITLVSEPWIPLISSFGLFLILKFKSYAYGFTLIILGIVLFYSVLFILLPSFNSEASGEIAFSKQSIYGSIISGHLFETFEVLMQPRKFFFIFFLFAPFLFIPVFGFRPLVVSIPDLLKLLFSSEILHTAVEGHYTIGLIAVLFIAYIEGLFFLVNKYKLNSFKISFLVLFCTLGFSFGHSPMIASFNFVSNWSSGNFNIGNYIVSSKTESFNSIKSLIVITPKTHIEIVNNSFYPEIVKTNKLYLFPSPNWQNADLILLSSNANPSRGAITGGEEYLNSYHQARDSIGDFFNLIFRDENLELWVKQP